MRGIPTRGRAPGGWRVTLSDRALAAAGGLVADRLVGEPPAPLHPVAGFGRAMRMVERRVWRDSRRAGGLHAAIGLGLGTGAGWALGAIGPGRRSCRLGPTGVAAWLATAGRDLGRQALAVSLELDLGDLARSRALLPGLVGRDPAEMDHQEVARAAVESVAENTVDAVVGPVLWAAVAGAPGALGYRAVNTLDAMVGHRSPRYRRFGWASARLDDIAGWIPARVTALIVALARPAAAGSVWRSVREDAPAHPSPNAGVAEAAFAAALGLRLGGLNRYGDRAEPRPRLGHGRPPGSADIAAAVDLSGDVSAVLAVVLALAAVAARGGLGCGPRA